MRLAPFLALMLFAPAVACDEPSPDYAHVGWEEPQIVDYWLDAAAFDLVDVSSTWLGVPQRGRPVDAVHHALAEEHAAHADLVLNDWA